MSENPHPEAPTSPIYPIVPLLTGMIWAMVPTGGAAIFRLAHGPNPIYTFTMVLGGIAIAFLGAFAIVASLRERRRPREQ